MFSDRLYVKCAECTYAGSRCDQLVPCETVLGELLEDLRYPEGEL